MTEMAKMTGTKEALKQPTGPGTAAGDYLTLEQAGLWASEYAGKEISTANIMYLIQYGRIRKHIFNGIRMVCKTELTSYYQSRIQGRIGPGSRADDWKKKLGEDLNWHLSFDRLREKDTTKHVHRLHPYKGKFIPQLVEYFLSSRTDEFKKEAPFRQGDIILDPFCGSGTTLVQANEMGMHALGVDLSAFNSFIANVKIGRYDFHKLAYETARITAALKEFVAETGAENARFEAELLSALNDYNQRFFPAPAYRMKLHNGELNEKEYAIPKEKEFAQIYHGLISKYRLQVRQPQSATFLDKWLLLPVRREIDFVFALIRELEDSPAKRVLAIILSRTLRSCRATTHADLATLKSPVTETYYCSKHGKICKPLFSISQWWTRYSRDTLERLKEFDGLRTETMQLCVAADARDPDFLQLLKNKNRDLYDRISAKKIRGIFSSPPYVGLIDYHEQHAYAYDLFGFARKDAMEIGPMAKGQGRAARASYAEGISAVLSNCKRFLADDFDVFFVANDKYGLYPGIADKAGMRIVRHYKRPVLNRTEKDKGAYAEIIFHLKNK